MDRPITVGPLCRTSWRKTDAVNPPRDFETNCFESPLVLLQSLALIECIIEEHSRRNRCLWSCVKNLPRMDMCNKSVNSLFTVRSLYSNFRFLIDWYQILEIRFPLSFHFLLWIADNLMLYRNLSGSLTLDSFCAPLSIPLSVIPAMHECCNFTVWPADRNRGNWNLLDRELHFLETCSSCWSCACWQFLKMRPPPPPFYKKFWQKPLGL